MIDVISGIHRRVSLADYSRLHHGFAPGGPQDRFSCRLTNRLLGNDECAEAIEFTLAPVRFTVMADCYIAVGGAPCAISVDGLSVHDWTVLAVKEGADVRIKIGQTGCRVYVCVAQKAAVGRRRQHSSFAWEPALGILRVLPGPEATDSALRQLVNRTWEVDQKSSGMGLRLVGEPLSLDSYDIKSSAVQDGTIQATADGLLALLRQRGTLGGYPRVATVIDCDVDRLAQFRPGSQLKFQIVSGDKAQELWLMQDESLERET